MAVNSQKASLKDVALFVNNDGKVDTIVNLLTQTNEILGHAIVVPCNNGSVHTTVVKTGIPSVAWRRLYKGVPYSKSEHAKVQETCGMMMGMTNIDYKMYELNGKSNQYLLEESSDAYEAINQTWADALFYGDPDVNPESFMGLSPRMGKCDGTDRKQSSYNVLSADFDRAANAKFTNKTDLTSMYCCVWSKQGFHCIIPKNGLSTIRETTIGDDGKWLTKDADGNEFPAVNVRYEFDCGLCVRDWRYCAALRNISLDTLDPGTTGYIDLFKYMTKMYYRIKKFKNRGNAYIYVNGDLFYWLDLQAQKKTSLTLTYSTIDGKEVLSFRGIPICECEAIKTNEAYVPHA